jgi:threonine synthase
MVRRFTPGRRDFTPPGASGKLQQAWQHDMRYVSTRGDAPVLDFEDVLLSGLARDGGLYVPETWPTFSAADFADMAGRPYTDVATRIVRPFAPSIAEDDIASMVEAAYGTFAHPAVAPLAQLDANEFLLELFHGPSRIWRCSCSVSSSPMCSPSAASR